LQVIIFIINTTAFIVESHPTCWSVRAKTAITRGFLTAFTARQLALRCWIEAIAATLDLFTFIAKLLTNKKWDYC
jgi:hypothetical protein